MVLRPLFKYIFIIFALVALNGDATLASNNDPIASSLNWQKYSLESKIEEKISHLLRVSVPDHQILVKVLIQAKAKEKSTRRQKFLDALSKNPDQKINIEEDLVLRKLDINKFDFAQSDSEQNTAPALPDLLEGIKDIDVILFFPKSAELKLRNDIVNLVSQLFDKKFNRNLNIVIADNPYANHAKMEKDLQPPSFEQKWKNFLLPAALVLAGVVCSIILFLGVGRLKQFSSDLSGALRDVGQNISKSILPEQEDTNNKNQTIVQDMVVASEVSNLQQISFIKFSGIKRYKKMLKHEFDDALILLNKWLKSDRPTEAQMVHLLFKSLEEPELFSLTDKLKLSQLQKIQNNMKVPLRENDIGILDKYIELSVMDILLDNKPRLNFNIRNFISNLTAKEAVSVRKELPVISGLLVYYLPQNILVDMVKLISEDDFSQCLKQASVFDKEFMMRHGAEIENYVNTKVGESNLKKESGFLHMLPMIVDSVSFSREMSLLKQVYNFCSIEEFYKLMLDMIPSSFLISYDQELAKSVFVSIPIKMRAVLVLTKPEQISWSLDEWLGPDGSKSREIVEIEIQDIKNDAKMLSEVNNTADKSWKEFFQKFRSVIKSNNDLQAQLQLSIKDWTDKTFDSVKSSTTGKKTNTKAKAA